MTSNRILQLEDLLKREISQIILTKVKDDRFKSFNIIDVKAASDLSSAKVYFSIINGNESDVPEIKFLEKFSSMIRSQVASEVVLKKVPKLKFISNIDAIRVWRIIWLPWQPMRAINSVRLTVNPFPYAFFFAVS